MKTLIRIGGALNLASAAFHVFLAFCFGRMPGIPCTALATMKMLNAVTIGAFLVLGLAMAFYATEVASTRIGRLLLALGAAIYLMRAAGEMCLMPVPKPLIAGICLVAALVHILALLRTCRGACACKCECGK
jgi:hypothetical protein